jgi:hypothetical protein
LYGFPELRSLWLLAHSHLQTVLARLIGYCQLVGWPLRYPDITLDIFLCLTRLKNIDGTVNIRLIDPYTTDEDPSRALERNPNAWWKYLEDMEELSLSSWSWEQALGIYHQQVHAISHR